MILAQVRVMIQCLLGSDLSWPSEADVRGCGDLLFDNSFLCGDLAADGRSLRFRV